MRQFLFLHKEDIMPLIAVDQLQSHPNNANRMSPAMFGKLVSHIRASGDYPPLIVRPHPSASQPDRYQILDGHHRLQALRQLGYQRVKCDVWNVDDDRAALLLATLNRLHGEDDPQRRGALLERLSQAMPLAELAKWLPEDAARIRKLIEAAHPPPALAPPPNPDHMLQAVTFFLSQQQRRRLFEQLAPICRDRSAALVKLLSLDQRPQADATQPVGTCMTNERSP
jgi:ParB-like chromosome segregation protein Spo0J